MGKYVKCPRCDLNWITQDQEYCEVCLAEIAGAIIIEDEEEVICPRCKQNYLEAGETICPSCRAAKVDDEEDVEIAKVDVVSDDATVSLAELEEKEWADDVDEPFDDDDGFGNADDFIPDDELELDDELDDELSDSTSDDDEEDDFPIGDLDDDYDDDDDDDEKEDDDDDFDL